MRKVIIYSYPTHHRRSEESTVKDIAPVIRETKTLVIAGHDGKEKYRLKKRDGTFTFPSPAEIAVAEKQLAETRERMRKLREEQAELEVRRRKDPRYELLDRFKCHGTDFEPWDKLSLEELQTIAAILNRHHN